MRVLIYTAETGGGHRRTAESVATYLETLPDATVAVVDAFKAVNPFVDKLVCTGYEAMAKRTPKLYGAVYRHTQKEGQDISKAITAVAARWLLPSVEEFDPDLIITTHPFAAEMVSVLKQRGKIDRPLLSLMTDYEAHRAYLVPGVDAYVLPAPECVEPMVAMGINRKRLFPYGIPVMAEFFPVTEAERQTLKTRLHLPGEPTLPTVLLMAGSFGLAGVLDIYDHMMALEEPFRLIVITGKNKKLYEAVEKKLEDATKPVELLYFTDVVQEYMQVSDLIITKPGGLTISEAMACNLPMVLCHPIPGQEEGNADFLVKRGMAVSIEEGESGAAVLQELLRHPEKLEEMKECCRQFDTSHARENLGKLVTSLSTPYTERRRELAMAERCVYLDNSATTRVCPEATQKAVEVMTAVFGNPSSLHHLGFLAEKELKQARATIAQTIGAEEEEIVFTSGGTESNNLAIFAGVEKQKRRGNTIVTTAIEHPSVANCMKKLEEQGYHVVRLKPDKQGQILPEAVVEAITKDTIFVSMMLVNNEVGSILPIEAAANAIARKGAPALLHVDAVQGFGKMPISVKRMRVDLLSMSGHKVYAPKGVGALYVKRGLALKPLQLGGGQEKGLRSGTEAMPMIAAFGAAVAALPAPADTLPRIQGLKDALVAKLQSIPGVTIHSPETGLPYVVNFSTGCIRSETMIHALSKEQIYVSGGSACSKGKDSPVLTAMGLSKQEIETSIRVSFSTESTLEEVEELAAKIQQAMETLASIS